MSRCNYNSKRIIPCPFLSLSKQFQRTPTGELIGTFWEGTITGTIVAYMGSPDSDSDLWDQGGYPPDEIVVSDARLGSIFRKQEAIRELFSIDYKSLEFQSADGSAPLRCNPRITGINFEEGQWFNVCRYSITFEADILYINGQPYGEDDVLYLNEANESWSFEPNDEYQTKTDRLMTLTHNVSAIGKTIYNENGDLMSGLVAWQWAKQWVTSKLGYDPSIVDSGLIGIPSYYQAYNNSRTQTVDETGGEFSVQETWILASGTATDNYTVNIRKQESDALTYVSVEGNINGLEQRDFNTGSVVGRYDNALLSYNSVSGSILSRAITQYGSYLNPNPVSESIVHDQFGGSINYSYEYNTRPANLIPNARFETITIQDDGDARIIAAIPIPGRLVGPILQDIFTYRERVRSVNIEAVINLPSGSIVDRYNAKPNTYFITDQIKPFASQVYQVNNSENFDVTTGRYSLNRQWVYE